MIIPAREPDSYPHPPWCPFAGYFPPIYSYFVTLPNGQNLVLSGIDIPTLEAAIDAMKGKRENEQV